MLRGENEDGCEEKNREEDREFMWVQGSRTITYNTGLSMSMLVSFTGPCEALASVREFCVLKST
jgi:hypothetical protein